MTYQEGPDCSTFTSSSGISPVALSCLTPSQLPIPEVVVTTSLFKAEGIDGPCTHSAMLGLAGLVQRMEATTCQRGRADFLLDRGCARTSIVPRDRGHWMKYQQLNSICKRHLKFQQVCLPASCMHGCSLYAGL